MLIIIIKEGESIDRVLKRFRKKFEKTRTMRKLRSRKEYIKPSVVRRSRIQKAKYTQKFRNAQAS